MPLQRDYGLASGRAIRARLETAEPRADDCLPCLCCAARRLFPAPRLDDADRNLQNRNHCLDGADGASVLEAAARSLPRHLLRVLDQRMLQRQMSKNPIMQLTHIYTLFRVGSDGRDDAGTEQRRDTAVQQLNDRHTAVAAGIDAKDSHATHQWALVVVLMTPSTWWHARQ